MSGPVTWSLTGQRDEIDRVLRRGHRYVVVDEDDVSDMDIQVGDWVTLWPGEWALMGDGIAAPVLHELVLLDSKDRAAWRIYTIGEPMEARAVTGGEEDDGGD